MASITEMSNPLTQNIDIADAADILRMLHQTDDQIFGGHGTPGIQDERFILSMEKACDFLSDSITSSIRKKECLRVILSGAGTSGRLAMLLSETFNDLCGSCFDPPLFDFLIAGGTRALIKSQESAEDDPQQGVEELEKFYSTCDRFIYIGITCGLSAQYVSGQLYHTVQNRQQPAILVGFNPLERARAIVPENWDKSFLDVLQAVQKAQDVFFLNPIIGPEPITGSTRMKGGTTTKIILETLFYAALKRVSKNIELKFSADPFLDDDSDTSATIRHLFTGYESAKNKIYSQADQLYAVLDQAGDTLKSHGHIVYLGEGAAGKWGIVDASECPPTFGADVFDVRGYIPDGWASFCKSCLKISDTDHDYDIGFQDFKEKILPGLSSKDLTVLTGTAPFYEKHQDLFASMDRTKVFQILIEPVSKTLKNNPSFDLIISGAKDWDEIPMFTSMMLKLVYNAITTAAHVFKGKVFQNKMIDLRISNNKLYHRAVQIIQGLIGVKESTAVDALLRSVYGTDRVASANRTAPVSSHIQATVGREGIVPVALLLATERFTIKQAMSRVEKEHIIRNIIKPVPES